MVDRQFSCMTPLAEMSTSLFRFWIRLSSLLYVAGFVGCSINVIFYVWNVVCLNGIILSIMPAFYYFISKKVWYPSRSSHLFQLFPLPQRESSEGFHISATFLFSFLFSSTIPSSQSWATTMLVINFLIPFISLWPPPLPPLCFMSSTPGSPFLPSSLSSSRTICLPQTHQYSPSPADSR